MTGNLPIFGKSASPSSDPRDLARGLVYALALAYDPPPKSDSEASSSFVYDEIYQPLFQAALNGHGALAEPLINKFYKAASRSSNAPKDMPENTPSKNDYADTAELALIISCAYCAEVVVAASISDTGVWLKYSEATYWAGMLIGIMGARASEKKWRAEKSRHGTKKRSKNFDAKKQLVIEYAKGIAGHENMPATQIALNVIQRETIGTIAHDTVLKHVRAWKKTLKAST